MNCLLLTRQRLGLMLHGQQVARGTQPLRMNYCRSNTKASKKFVLHLLRLPRGYLLIHFSTCELLSTYSMGSVTIDVRFSGQQGLRGPKCRVLRSFWPSQIILQVMLLVAGESGQFTADFQACLWVFEDAIEFANADASCTRHAPSNRHHQRDAQADSGIANMGSRPYRG